LLAQASDATGATGREVLFGQLAEGALGLYVAMDAEWKYVYSAPDDREYLLYRGPGEGPACDRNECHDRAGQPDDPPARAALERLRTALIERFRRDGYEDPLDPSSSTGLRRYPRPALGWEPLDEMEDRSVVARGWQFARWNRLPPHDGPVYDRRKDPAKAAYAFPPLDVRAEPPLREGER
jgi:hypothetical protein